MKHIAHALAERRECLREATGEWLDIVTVAADQEPDISEYRAGFALMLLTAARVKTPLAKLLKLMALDWDWMNEAYMKMLQATADAGTVAELLAVYPTLEWHERLFTSGVIAKCWRREHEAAADKVVPFVNTADMIGRNDPCPCGSGRKYKKCCME